MDRVDREKARVLREHSEKERRLREFKGDVQIHESDLVVAWRAYAERQKLRAGTTEYVSLQRAFRAGWESRPHHVPDILYKIVEYEPGKYVIHGFSRKLTQIRMVGTEQECRDWIKEQEKQT